MKKKKPKYNVKMDAASNGVLATVEKGREIIGSKVFYNRDLFRIKRWLDRLIGGDKQSIKLTGGDK